MRAHELVTRKLDVCVTESTTGALFQLCCVTSWDRGGNTRTNKQFFAKSTEKAILLSVTFLNLQQRNLLRGELPKYVVTRATARTDLHATTLWYKLGKNVACITSP